MWQTIGLIAGLFFPIWELLKYFIPKKNHRTLNLLIIVIYCVSILVLVFVHTNLGDLYKRHINIFVFIQFILIAYLFYRLWRYAKQYKTLKKNISDKILIKEYFKDGNIDQPIEIIIDSVKHCGTYYFDGRCILLPKGTYKIVANPSNPGGWSAWARDDAKELGSVEGAWTWNLLISVPGISDDFLDAQYYPIQSFEKAWQMGSWKNAWIFKKKEDVTYANLKHYNFKVEHEFTLEYVSPVWFWLWDQITYDNRGEIRILLYKIE